jgi:hypothetical protein
MQYQCLPPDCLKHSENVILSWFSKGGFGGTHTKLLERLGRRWGSSLQATTCLSRRSTAKAEEVSDVSVES